MYDWKNDITAAIGAGDHPPWLAKILAADPPEQTNRKRVVALSGGKDSTAMAMALSYFEPASYIFVCTPTGNELPVMFAHWVKIGEMLGRPLLPVSRHSLRSLIKKQRALPNHKARWCTRILKLEEYYRWLADQTPCISYVGLRADEEGRTGMIFPDADGVQMDFPMKRWGWTIDDVKEFLAFLSVEIPERTDCAICFWQKIGEWFLLWRDNIDAYMEGEELEQWVSAERGAEFTLRSAQRDSWPASLHDLRLEFEKGRIPTVSLKMMDKNRLVGACRVCTL
jgi:3'-phosphoadenosine 5'-phosphosulfate sulfotransferase (PAPS reductase)/FAD synthetase